MPESSFVSYFSVFIRPRMSMAEKKAFEISRCEGNKRFAWAREPKGISRFASKREMKVSGRIKNWYEDSRGSYKSRRIRGTLHSSVAGIYAGWEKKYLFLSFRDAGTSFANGYPVCLRITKQFIFFLAVSVRNTVSLFYYFLTFSLSYSDFSRVPVVPGGK